MLEGKTIVVTGVGDGLGREVVQRCLDDGANVMMGARNSGRLEKTASELDPAGERVAFAPVDISDSAACDAVIETAEKRFGRVDGLVQVAAFELAVGELFETDFDWWRQAMETNVYGALQMLRSAVTGMRRSGGGSAVFIGSQSMFQPAMPQMGYAASKGALLSTMFYLARDFAPEKIRVNTVMPSWMWGPQVELYTKMQAKDRDTTPELIKKEIESGIPMGEIVPDEEVANAVGFLLSDRSRMITGQTLAVNGGEWMR